MMLLGIVGNPPEGHRSETAVLEEIIALAGAIDRVMSESRSMPTKEWERIEQYTEQIWRHALALQKQIRGGVHVNGRKQGGRKMSDHVQAIVYTHEEDGKFYVHGFGDADLTLSVRGDVLRIEGLEDRTHVQMFAQPDGSVKVVGKDGQNLWEDFD